MSKRGAFFAVDRNRWGDVCALGMNPAVAYLTLACFSGRDNATTAASTHAIEKHTAISRGRAKAAIEALEKGGFVTRLRAGKHPRYRIATTDAGWIWLPNALVTGAAGETPPVERVRQTQDPLALRLLVELYGAQNLLENGGIDRKAVWATYTRKLIASRGAYTVWGFDFDVMNAQWTDIVLPHRRPPTKEERERGGDEAVDFWTRWRWLLQVGLVEQIPTIFDGAGPDAEPIHPMCFRGTDDPEDRIGAAARRAAEVMLGAANDTVSSDTILVPLPRHFANVAMVGIYRLRYRPHTGLTAAWWHKLAKRCELGVAIYDKLAAGEWDVPLAG